MMYTLFNRLMLLREADVAADHVFLDYVDAVWVI